MSKFVLHKDLGAIIVPENYRSDELLTDFFRVTDKSTPEFTIVPEYTMQPGERLHVRLFEQSNRDEEITFKDCIDFLKEQDAVFVGAHGLVLVVMQKHADLEAEILLSAFSTADVTSDPRFADMVLRVDSVEYSVVRYDGEFWLVHGKLVCFSKII